MESRERGAEDTAGEEANAEIECIRQKSVPRKMRQGLLRVVEEFVLEDGKVW